MMSLTTLVLGASPRPDRYAYLAVMRLVGHDIPVVAVGLRKAMIGEVPIHTEIPDGVVVHTVTLYLSARNQLSWTERLLALNPQRIIFNPGTEHPEFEAEARSKGIEVVRGCTLVMLSLGNY